jgi:hypothetical protein
LQHRVAEELQPLVGLDGSTLLMGDGRMGQSQAKQIKVLKGVSEPVLQFV